MEASALQAPASISRLSLSAPLLRLRSDDQLVALFRAGSDRAFDVIHDRYRQRLFAYARQMLGGSRQDAEDALQDVFLRAYGALRADDRSITLRAWLYRVAHNRCVDQIRRPVPAPSDVEATSRAPLHDPLAITQRREDLRRLVEDVRRLPEQQRSALLMREIDGLSYTELADALGVSVAAVKSLLVRARVGLVDASAARDMDCHEIRSSLALAYDRGVRATGQARRHMRDCAGCREYKLGLRGVQRSFSALTPAAVGPLGLLAKLFGIGAGGGGAAAGSGAVAGGGAIAGGGAAAATKVAVVCCAALTAGGGVVVVEHELKKPANDKPAAASRIAPGRGAPAHAAAVAAAATVNPVRGDRPVAVGPDERTARARARAIVPTREMLAREEFSSSAPILDALPEEHAGTGGTLAPDEPLVETPVDGAARPTGPAPTATQETGGESASPSPSAGSGATSGTASPGTSGGAVVPDETGPPPPSR